jgi:hypothetical protein
MSERKEKVSLDFFKHFDSNGDHTCCTLWGNRDCTCVFLGVRGPMGEHEVCFFTPGKEVDLDRRGPDSRGTLIPHDNCPFSNVSPKEPEIIVKQAHVTTCMGQINHLFGVALDCLSAEERAELDKIGYTGKNSAGEKMHWSAYLNSLGKGHFSVEQTKFDNGDFTEKFTVTHTITK